MLQPQILPPIRPRHRLVHLFVQCAQLDDVGRSLVGIVESIVGCGESFLAGEHNRLAMGIVAFADGFEAGCVGWERERLETVSWGITLSRFMCRSISNNPYQVYKRL